MVIEWLWALLFVIVVGACGVGLYYVSNPRDTEQVLMHARNVFIGGIVIGILGASWITWEVLN